MTLEVQNSRDGSTWSSHGLVLGYATRTVGSVEREFPTLSRLGMYMFSVDTDTGQRDDETVEDWERRINIELNWFKNLDMTTLNLV